MKHCLKLFHSQKNIDIKLFMYTHFGHDKFKSNIHIVSIFSILLSIELWNGRLYICYKTV